MKKVKEPLPFGKPEARKKKKRSAKALRREANGLLHKIVCNGKDCARGGDCGGNLQTSHILPKGQYKNLQWEPLNCLPMCYRHHLNWWHKNPIEAKDWFADTFPARYVWLQEHKNEVRRTRNIQEVVDELKQMLEKQKL